MPRSAKEAARSLTAFAHDQGSCFATAQAVQAGCGYKHLDGHETAGTSTGRVGCMETARPVMADLGAG
jgi:hypothetical protein